MKPADFDRFFAALHGVLPFRWQSRLAAQVAEGIWPGAVKLPTGAGKTALIDIALFHLALDAAKPAAQRSAARRIYFVVDRRLVVDEAYRRALRIETKLAAATEGILAQAAAALRHLAGGEGPPLLVKRLRGGMPMEKAFIDSPLQPAVVLSTVDQVGSRLLFRGYGVKEYARPIHAALVGMDSLILLDEAHLSQPFAQTLGRVRRYQQAPAWAELAVGRPLTVVEMTATPASGNAPFALTPEDRADERLASRLGAPKPTELIELATDKDDRLAAQKSLAHAMAEQAMRLMAEFRSNERKPVIGVVANRVLTARLTWEALKHAGEEAILLTGRMRSLDRRETESRYAHRILADRSVEGDPLFVVATQTVEVGADFDFDGLVTESAALDALRQRFGRLARLGTRPWCRAVVVHDKQALRDDPVYGGALSETWKWLKEQGHKPRKAKHPLIDFGIGALEKILPSGDILNRLLTPARSASVLMPKHMDMLVQTSPAPLVEPDLALLLHGAGGRVGDVQLVWRADVPRDLSKDIERTVVATVALLPPVAEESLSLPLATVRRLLALLGPQELADVEGSADSESVPARENLPWVVRWRGPGDDSSVEPLERIRPGDTIVLSAARGGLDRIVGAPLLPYDVGDIARQRRDEYLMRLHPALVPDWFRSAAAKEESVAEAQRILRELLSNFAEAESADQAAREAASAIAGLPGLDEDVGQVLSRLQETGKALAYPDEEAPQGILLTEPRNSVHAFTDDDDSSSLTRRIFLQDHCRRVGEQARDYAVALALPAPLAHAVDRAGCFHDLGKSDPRFQAWLRGGDRAAARRAAEPLAKSEMRAQDSLARERARQFAGYPKGARHECYSAALLDAHSALLEGESDADLVAYLVGTHHGRGRPFMPAVEDSGMSARFQFGDCSIDWSGPHGLEKLDSGWADRFWRLVRRHGYWGLAYLETLVRLADQRQTAREMEDRASSVQHRSIGASLASIKRHGKSRTDLHHLPLTGLYASNPLGALAAFGLLRTLDGLASFENAALAWRQTDDWQAVLVTSQPVARESLTAALAAWQSACDMSAFNWSDDIRVESDDFHERLDRYAASADMHERALADYFAAFGSELATDGAKGLVKPTALHMTSGQQKFLKGLLELSEGLRGDGQSAFDEALFGPWRYQDEQHSMGWDPATERMAALRHVAPTREKAKSVRAAVWLAAQALPLLPTAAVESSRGTRLETTAFARRHGEWMFRWPVWQAPIELPTLKSLLAANWQQAERLDRDGLARRGVAAVYQSVQYRFGQGYGIFRPATPLAWG